MLLYLMHCKGITGTLKLIQFIFLITLKRSKIAKSLIERLQLKMKKAAPLQLSS